MMNPLRLPRRALALWSAMICAGLAGCYGVRTAQPAALLPWVPLVGLSEFFWLPTFGRRASLSMAMAVHLAALALLPAPLAALLAGLGALVADSVIQRKPFVKGLYNASLVVVTMRLAAIPLHWGGVFEQLPVAWRAVGFVLVGGIYWGCNRIGVTCIIAASAELPWYQVWREDFGFGYEVLSTGVQVVLGGILVLIWPLAGAIVLPAMALLAFFIRDAYRRRNQLEELETAQRMQEKAA